MWWGRDSSRPKILWTPIYSRNFTSVYVAGLNFAGLIVNEEPEK